MNRLILVAAACALLVLSGAALASEQFAETHVLVFGGTGRLGSDIVKRLVADGHKVTVFARKESSRERLEDLPVSVVFGDVLVPESIDAALSESGIQVVVDALGRGTAGPDFYKTSAENIANSAAVNDVRQIVLHGSVGAGDSEAAFAGRNMSGMRSLFAAKTAGEQAVKASGVHYTIIRNSRLARYGSPDNGNAKLYEDAMLTGTVTRAALARLTAGCVMNPDCFNKTYHAVDKTR